MNKDLFRYLKFVGNFLYKTFNIINLPFLCAVYALKKLQQQRCQMNIIGIALKELAVRRKLATVDTNTDMYYYCRPQQTFVSCVNKFYVFQA